MFESKVCFTRRWCSDYQTVRLLGFAGWAPSDRFCISLKHNQRKQVARLMSGYLQQHFHKAKSPRDKDKPIWGRAFPSSFSVFDHRPASSNAARQSDGFIDSFRIKTSTKTLRAFFVWGLYTRQKFMFIKEKFSDLPLILMECCILLFNACISDVVWTYRCCMFALYSLFCVILATRNSLEIEPMTLKCRHDGTKAEWRLSLCRRILS